MSVLVRIAVNPMVMMLCDLAGVFRRREVIREHADSALVVVHCLILSGWVSLQSDDREHDSPSTTRVDSTVRGSMRTYSFRMRPSSSDSPGMMDPSIASSFGPAFSSSGWGGFEAVCFRLMLVVFVCVLSGDGLSVSFSDHHVQYNVKSPYLIGRGMADTSSTAVSLLRKWNLLGGIIAFGSSTSGGMILWCSGICPGGISSTSSSSTCIVFCDCISGAGRGNLDFASALLLKNSSKLERSAGCRLSKVRIKSLMSTATSVGSSVFIVGGVEGCEDIRAGSSSGNLTPLECSIFFKSST